jgi:hypothetical protein
MRDLHTLDKYRILSPLYGELGDGGNGCFLLPSPLSGEKDSLRVVASSGFGWDHVSVSLGNRTPTWTEMEFIKRKFFRDDETAMQLHVPPAKHISCHPYCLHIWRPQDVVIPLPPDYMVGPKEK